jgi:hypothetical protein
LQMISTFVMNTKKVKIRLPLMPFSFKVEKNDNSLITAKETALLEQLLSEVNENTMQQAISMMHEFFCFCRKEFEKLLPKMIELGIFTMAQFNEMVKDSPSTESSENFTKFLEEPFSVYLPDIDSFKEGKFGISMECTWDMEHGVGVWFENWKPVKSGFADTAYPPPSEL